MPSIQFKGKTVVETYHHSVPHHRLEFDSGLSVLVRGEKPALSGNLIIDGDNLLALKSLLPTHAGTVRCIYIDPPYNTGDEKWVYSDNLSQPQFKEWIGQTVGKEAEDATRHDKWACMMMPRLLLLRELLHREGAMFISIDDNEYHLLRCLLDEIFGREGFIATLIWQKRYSRDNRPGINAVHDYVVVVAESEEVFKRNRNRLPPDENQLRVYRNPNNDPRGRWRAIPMTAQGYRKNQMYKIETPTGVVHEPPAGRCWSMVESQYKTLLTEGTSIGASKRGRIWFGKNGNASPGVIRYLDEIEGFVPWTWLPHEEVGHTDEAKKEVYEILGTEYPTTPKPTRLIKRILQMYTRPDAGDLVLDAFAGTGTTAHAVLEMNKLDGGNRRFVLVQQPYETKEQVADSLNICERVTAERVRRVITGYAFEGTKTEILLEERLNLENLRNANEILDEMTTMKEQAEDRFDEVRIEAADGVVRIVGAKRVKGKVEGLGGSFTYARLGESLFREYRDFGARLPAFAELAKYIFYTETSTDIDLTKADEVSGFIGATEGAGGTSYYLFYTPTKREDREVSLTRLKQLASSDKRKRWVIYCEKLWLHPDELRRFEAENSKRIRIALVPFNLK